MSHAQRRCALHQAHIHRAVDGSEMRMSTQLPRNAHCVREAILDEEIKLVQGDAAKQ